MRSEPSGEMGLTEMAEEGLMAPGVRSFTEAMMWGAGLKLHAGVKLLGVLAHHHEVHVAVATAVPGHGEARPHAGVEVERAAQGHVDGAEPGAHRGGGGALDGDLRLGDGLEHRVGQRRAAPLVDLGPRALAPPSDVDAGGGDDLLHGRGNLGADAVPGDEGDVVGHGTLLSLCSAGPSAVGLGGLDDLLGVGLDVG